MRNALRAIRAPSCGARKAGTHRVVLYRGIDGSGSASPSLGALRSDHGPGGKWITPLRGAIDSPECQVCSSPSFHKVCPARWRRQRGARTQEEEVRVRVVCRIAEGSLVEKGSGFYRPDRTGAHFLDGSLNLHFVLNHHLLVISSLKHLVFQSQKANTGPFLT